jgi:hypothetical protein
VSFDLSDYVDVAARIELFYGKHPQGTLQGSGEFVRDEQGRIFGYVYRAEAYRDPEDTRPGVGTAFEPIPGATPYTKDSEVMNAETSAWGRAIVACGFPSKHIASANEVRARQEDRTPTASEPRPGNPAAAAQAAYEQARPIPEDDGKPENVLMTFGKHKGKTLGEAGEGYWKWLDENYEAKNPEQRRILEAARMLLGLGPQAEDPYSDIPFGPVPV